MNDKVEKKPEIDAEKITAYWVQSSDNDFSTMNNLFSSKDYHWSLFVGHLVIEKLLKAYFVRSKNGYPPFIHDLRRLAETANLILTDEQKVFFDTVTRFNINARYDDYKLKFFKLCTRDFAKAWIAKITEHRKWIKETLLKS
jgi:HEPN domain-containing protein